MATPRRRLQSALRSRPGVDDNGSVLVWLLLVLPVLFAFGGLVLDGGRVITSRQDAANIAEQAARKAVDQLNQGAFRSTGTGTGSGSGVGAVDLPAATTAGCSYVRAAAPAASCAMSLTSTGQVRVDVTITTRTALLAAVGVPRITVTGTGQSRPAIGVTEEVLP